MTAEPISTHTHFLEGNIQEDLDENTIANLSYLTWTPFL